METTIVLLDASAPSKMDGPHKRDELFLNEKVMTDSPTTEKEDNFPFVVSTHSSSDLADDPPAGGRPGAPIPACFATQSACEAATNSCSGHGICADRWGLEETKNSCFFCYCKKAHADANSTKVYNWGGAMCQKRDVSTPFWLFASVTITLVGTIAFSIGLLFNVGEQKLPGVIGAGVSRSK